MRIDRFYHSSTLVEQVTALSRTGCTTAWMETLTGFIYTTRYSGMTRYSVRLSGTTRHCFSTLHLRKPNPSCIACLSCGEGCGGHQTTHPSFSSRTRTWKYIRCPAPYSPAKAVAVTFSTTGASEQSTTTGDDPSSPPRSEKSDNPDVSPLAVSLPPLRRVRFAAWEGKVDTLWMVEPLSTSASEPAISTALEVSPGCQTHRAARKHANQRWWGVDAADENAWQELLCTFRTKAPQPYPSIWRLVVCAYTINTSRRPTTEGGTAKSQGVQK